MRSRIRIHINVKSRIQASKWKEGSGSASKGSRSGTLVEIERDNIVTRVKHTFLSVYGTKNRFSFICFYWYSTMLFQSDFAGITAVLSNWCLTCDSMLSSIEQQVSPCEQVFVKLRITGFMYWLGLLSWLRTSNGVGGGALSGGRGGGGWGVSVKIHLISTPSNLSPTRPPSGLKPPVLCGFCCFSRNAHCKNVCVWSRNFLTSNPSWFCVNFLFNKKYPRGIP